MRNKLVPILAACMLILTMLACSLGGGQSTAQPNLAGTIAAQSLTLQALGGTPQLAGTPLSPLPQNTLQPTDNPPPQNTPQPVNTPRPLPQNTPRPASTPLPAAPSEPQNFTANGSATAIAFTWNDNSLNETGFRIYQEGVTPPIASIDTHAATGGMSYNWTGLPCGFKGKFSIRAYNAAGESGSSNAQDGVTIPCQPTNLIGTGQGNIISFNWAVSNPHNEDGFRIYQQGVSAPVATRGPNKGSGGTIFDLDGLLCNLVATYSVTAFNSAGESPASNLIQAETVPCPPSGFAVTSVTKDTVKYMWTDNATSETGYHVYQDDVLYATLPPNPANGIMSNDAFQLCNVNFVITHVYSVRAFNYAGESGSSNHVGASTPVC
jgi:hypothetical protein